MGDQELVSEAGVARLDERLRTVEREVGALKSASEEHRSNDTTRWDALLVSFGELKAKVEGLNGRMAGYLIAGMLLSGAVSVLAGHMLGAR